MKLTPLERLDLSDQLDELMTKVSGAKGPDLLDLNDQIDEVMTRLGYGVVAPDDTPPPPAPLSDLVADFLADKFINQPLDDFLNTLYKLESYVGTDLTFAQVKEHSANWVASSGLAA